MLIPNKYSGYSFDGVRRCFGGGGGGGGGGDGGTGDAGSAAGGDVGPGAAGTGNGTAAGGGDGSSAGGGGGPNTPYVPPVVNTGGGGGGGSTAPTPWNPTSVARQPVYQPQYQNYNTGNAMNVSQYGQQPPYGGGLSGTGLASTIAQAINGRQSTQQPQMNWQTGQMTQPAQQTSMFGGQMQGGGYGDYGMNNPFSPYSNSFLNLDPNLNRGTQADKANAYRNAIQSGFGDQQIYNQATGLFGQQSPQAWGHLQASAMGMTPSVGDTVKSQTDFYQNARNQGFNDQTIRSAANQIFGNQTQSDWSYLQNKSGYGGGFGGYGNQFMPQMQNPYSYQPTQAATPYQSPVAQRTSSGPSQAIVGRSSQMRGTPNVMRRAEGGIASLMDDEE